MMPFTLFMILGIIQLSLMQQARLLTQYAAFRAARAGALNQADCRKMTDAAVEGILASYGRTDSSLETIATWTLNNPLHGSPKDNLTNVSGAAPKTLQKIVRITYEVDNISTAPSGPYDPLDFDDPGKGLRLSVQILYNYEMRIPFADWMIHEMWTGGNYFADSVDLLSPSKNVAPNVKLANQQRQDDNTDALVLGRNNARYFLPMPASSAMRMMSNPLSTVTIGSAAQCP